MSKRIENSIIKQIVQYDIDTKGEIPISDIAKKFSKNPYFSKTVCRILRANGRGRMNLPKKIQVFGVKVVEANKITMQINKPLLEKAGKIAESKNIRTEELIREIVQNGLESIV